METYKVKICDKDVVIRKTPGKAIKAHCTDCSAGNRTEVAECPNNLCPLYPYRGFLQFEGKKREYSEQEREILRERLARNRKQRLG